MKFNRVMATVSAVALATAAGVSGASAYSALFDLTPTADLTGLTVSSSVVANEQNNTSVILSALNSASSIVIPIPPAAQDVDGGVISGLVATSTIYSIAVGNLAADGYPGLKTEAQFGKSAPGNFVDLFTADGSVNQSAATAASLQTNVLGAIKADNTGGSISSNFIDLGSGSSIALDKNQIYSEGAGNLAVTTVSGDINPGLVGGDLGSSTVTNPAVNELQSGATVLAASAQENIDLTLASATVSGARIGSQATVDLAPDPTLTTLKNSKLDITDSTIRAQFTGNDATTTVIIDNDKTLTLNGSAGVSNLQYATGDAAYTASVTGSVIEFGDSASKAGVVDLDGSTLNFTGNDILAAASANQAANGVLLDKGVTINGPTGGGAQANTFSAGTPDVANVAADLFSQNVQYNTVAASASAVSDLNVLVEDLQGKSSILTLDNSIGAEATGDGALSSIQVLDAQAFSSLVALQSIQYNEGSQKASIGQAADGATLLVSVATLNAGGVIANSSITTEGNRLYTEAVGNDSDTSILINGGTISGKNTVPTLRVDRPTTSGANPAEISLVNGQVTDGGDVEATTISNIRANLALNGGVASEIDSSTISTSQNEISALAIGNRSTESTVGITANTLNATAGVINSQTVEDGTVLVAGTDSPSAVTGQLQVWSFPNQITNSKIVTDANIFSAKVYGNLADDTTNALSVNAQTVSNAATYPYVRVDRSGTTSDVKVSAGLSVLNDQSVEDLEAAVVTAKSGEIVDPAGQGDLIYVRLGLSNQFAFTSNTITVNDNQGTVAATLNDATNKLTVNAGSLDSPSALVNVQSVADDNNNGKSAAMIADQYDADITLSVGITGDGSPASMSNNTFSIDSNDLLASAVVNTAVNTASITAGSQALTTTKASAYAILFDQNVDWVNVNAENTLVNDQVFTNLSNSGNGKSLQVLNDNSDLDLLLGTTGAFNDNVVSIDKNTMTVEALGNVAVNSLTLAVDNFDLSKASDTGTAANGPIAMLASNQVGEVVNQGTNLGLSAEGDTLRAIVDMNAVTGVVGGSKVGSSAISIDGNQFLVHAEVNSVSNTLTAKGVTVPDVVGTTNPMADLGDTSLSFPIGFSPDTTFGLASRQVNSLDVTALLDGSGGGTPVGMRIDADGTSAIDTTALSISNNALVAEARGSDSSNTMTLDYNTNNAQGFLANSQSIGGDLKISATVFDVELLIDLDEDTVVPPTITLTDTSVTLSKNSIVAAASSNRTTNTFTVTGTDIYSGSDAAPGVTVQNPLAGPVPGPAGANPIIRATGDLALVNQQGSAGNITAIPNAEQVASKVEQVRITGNIDTFDSGALTVDNNLVLSQSLIHGASNTLTVKATAAIGAEGDTPGASVVSLQTLATDAKASAVTTGVYIGAFDVAPNVVGGVDTLSDPGAVALAVTNNGVGSVAVGGSANNTLSVSAGSSLLGGVTAPAPVIGLPGTDDTTLNADYNVLNVQTGFSDGGTISALTQFTSLGLVTKSGLNGDSLTVSNNIGQASATGFFASNTLALNAKASSDATGQVGNIQVLNDIGIDSKVSSTGFAMDVGGGALNSAVTASGNVLNATSSANSALNALSVTGGSLQESSGAGVTVDPTATARIAATGADYAVLNMQSVSNGSVTSTATGLLIGIDDMGPAGFNNTAVSVSDNSISAVAVGNEATNTLTLDTGTFQHPSAAIANLQSNSGMTISASVDGAAIGIGYSSTLNGASSGSSFTVQGNSIGAIATGNSAVNSIRSGD